MRQKKPYNKKWNLILSMLIFGSIGLFRRSIDLPSSMIACLRGLVGGAFLLLFVLLRKKNMDTDALKKNLPVLIVSGIVIGFNWILLFEAYRYTSVAIATLCYYMAPIVVILFSPLLFGEKITGRKALCVLVALLGMVLVSGVTSFRLEASEMRGIFLGLGAAALYAAIVLINKKLPPLDAYGKTVVQLLSAGIVLIPYVLLTEDLTAVHFEQKELVLLAIVCIVHTGFAYALYFGAVSAIPAQTSAIFSYIDPVTAIFLSAFLLHEDMTVPGIIGTVLVLGGTIASEFADKKKPEAQTQAKS